MSIGIAEDVACIAVVELLGLVVFLTDVDGAAATLVDVTAVIVFVDIGIRDGVVVSMTFAGGVVIKVGVVVAVSVPAVVATVAVAVVELIA